MMTTQSQRSRRSEFCCFCYSHAATCSVVLLVAFASVALSAAVGESAAAAQQQQQQSSGRNQAAPIQQQQQAAAVAPPPPPPLQSIDSSQQPNLASSSSGGQQPVGSGQQQQLQQQRPKLPNINLYISKNEMRKLLGIESPINYVTNGNIDTYPFKFSIPLGYNQSDIVFTWQNLGHTNVNYSISLVINKIHAIDPPLINITRSGLIPRHEQGKTTDDVDVQVLINILGFVPLEASPAQQPNIRQQSDQDEATPNMDLGGVAGLQPGNASAAPASNSIQDSAMQADAPEPQMRLVSHTLAIKRHKICAMHPVLFDHRQTTPTPLGGRAEIVRPPNQQPNQQPPVSPQPAPQVNYGPTPSATAADSRWTHESAPVSPPTPANHFIRHPTPSPAIEPTIVEPPAHHPHLNVPPATPMGPRKPAPEPPAAWPSPRQPPPSNQLGPENPLAEILFRQQQQQQHHHHHHQPTGYNPLFWSLLSLSLIVSIAAILLLLFLNGAAAVGPTGKPLNNKLAMLKSLLVRRSHHPHSGHLKHAGHHHHRTMSINSQHSSMLKARHQHSPIMAKSAIIGTLRMSRPKSSASSLSGLSAVDLANELNLHQHHQQKSAQFYSYKAQKNSISPPAGTNMTRAYPTGFYSGTSSQTLSQHSANSNANNYQHHHYQQPPTADLLGTGYQCQAYQQQQQHPIYHIATNNNQTTRLIWNNNGNGANSGAFTIDAGSYMPLTDAPKSDSGSVYQTIY